MARLRRSRRTADDAAIADERPVRRRSRLGGGALVAGSLLSAIARLVMLATMIAVGIIVAAILLRVLDANARNSIVSDVHDAGRWLVAPFGSLFTIKDAKESIAVNWGVPAAIYFVVGSFIAGMLRSAALGAAATAGDHVAAREAPVA